MKKFIYLVFVLSVSISYSQNTFRLWHFNAKDGTEEAIGNLLAEHNKDAAFKSGGVQIERISYGDNMWTHRVVAFGEVGKIGRTDLKEFQQDLFLEKINNFVEEWGPAYAGRFLSFVGGVPKDFPFIQIYNIKPNDPFAFQKAHDKFVGKASKILGDRPVGFGTYDINKPDGATHWAAVSGKSEEDHIKLLEKLEKMSEFYSFLDNRGPVEDIRDYETYILELYE